MAGKKIIAVVGATGAQGGGLVRAILSERNGEFAARAPTRDVPSDQAKALAEAGAEVVATNVDDPASLRNAFEDAHAAFCVTFFRARFSPEKELAEAKSMAGAARQTGVSHVIWSTLEDTRMPTSWTNTRCRISTPRAKRTSISPRPAHLPRFC